MRYKSRGSSRRNGRRMERENLFCAPLRAPCATENDVGEATLRHSPASGRGASSSGWDASLSVGQARVAASLVLWLGGNRRLHAAGGAKAAVRCRLES